MSISTLNCGVGKKRACGSIAVAWNMETHNDDVASTSLDSIDTNTIHIKHFKKNYNCTTDNEDNCMLDTTLTAGSVKSEHRGTSMSMQNCKKIPTLPTNIVASDTKKIKKCPHGISKISCRICSPYMFCEHGRRRSLCRDCGTGYCEHGRIKSSCIGCGNGKNVHMVLPRSAVGFALHTTTASTGGIRESVKIAGRDIAYTDVGNHNVKTAAQDIVNMEGQSTHVKTVTKDSACTDVQKKDVKTAGQNAVSTDG